ncbi:ABC transporter permease [Pseudomonas sichuanensis]|uniref:ABC transporter permease n=1 Tax=Pseudomonas sichuanensis TaxID=2213015 RepID=UPI002ABAF038|nr:ABC transporter permease [Pseudomonas sichuanensis]MDZ4019270.1 Putrescine transport system permease protein PotH [Pseudomonas sichuanensis]
MSISRNSVDSLRLFVTCLPAVITFVVVFAVPMVLIFKLGVSTEDGAFSLKNFVAIAGDEYYQEIFARTFKLAALVTIVAVAIGVFEGYYLNGLYGRMRMLVLMAILGPLFVSVVVRTLGWQIILSNNGPISQFLQMIGLAEGPADLLFGELAIFIGLLHMVLPYMILNIWTALMSYDDKTEKAARSLGAGSGTVFFKIVLPQIMPGVLSGALTVFALSMSAFATPALLGGRTTKVVATAVYDEFLSTFNWNLGASIAIILLALNIFTAFFLNKWVERKFKGVFA